MSKQKQPETIINIKVIPNAPKNEIVGWEEGRLKIKIRAQPEKNRANKELINFLSETFNVAKKDILILRGETSRIKKILIRSFLHLPD